LHRLYYFEREFDRAYKSRVVVQFETFGALASMSVIEILQQLRMIHAFSEMFDML